MILFAEIGANRFCVGKEALHDVRLAFELVILFVGIVDEMEELWLDGDLDRSG